MKSYYRWFKFDEVNDLVEVTKDLFPENDPYVNKEHGWDKMPETEMKIKVKEDKEDGKER